MKSILLSFSMIIFASTAIACTAHDGLPDSSPDCTPGSIDPSIKQDNIQMTICVPGYTAKVRPSVAVTNKMKRQVMAEYGLEGQDPSLYEGDHALPIEAGGCPGPDADCDFHANFWPQKWLSPFGAHDKDKIENRCHRAICSGRITLKDAQAQLMTDWRTACQ